MKWQTVIDFWFHEIDEKQWWVKDAAFDQLIRNRFSKFLKMASVCELYKWREQPEGRLAEIIILDQFSRNIYRDTTGSFANDPLALCLAQEAVRLDLHLDLPLQKRLFLLMPYMHSESLLIHEEAVQLFDKSGLEDNLQFELKHKAIIERFGRYPHRNEILGRPSTEEELDFLKQPGSSF